VKKKWNKLISVISRTQGEEEVETWWGLHPQFRRDLPPDEAKELAKHMNRVTRIVGERFAIVVSLAQAGASRPVGLSRLLRLEPVDPSGMPESLSSIP
jgi:hypothetical protein